MADTSQGSLRGLNRTDAIVFGVNGTALGLHIANVAWRSPALVYAVTVATLALFAVVGRRDATLRGVLAFGLLVALLWAAVEAGMVGVFGWWGGYVVGGPQVLETPVYCLLLGATGATYVAYVARRGAALGFRRVPVAVVTLLNALLLAVIGEALLVAAGFWTYVAWDPAIGGVPVVVPLSYGLPYFFVPWLPERRSFVTALAFHAITCAAIAAMCLATGFPGR